MAADAANRILTADPGPEGRKKVAALVGEVCKDDAILAAWSPLSHVDAVVSPVFVYQGVKDPVTPRDEADQIVVALRRRGIPVEYMLIANEGHGITRRDNKIAYLVRSFRFIADHLGLAR